MKAQLARKRKHRAHEKIDAGADTVVESKSITPVSSCQTTVQVVSAEHKGEAGQTKGEQVLEALDTPAVCCRKVRKTESENITVGESGERKGQEKVLEELDNALVVHVSDELVGEIKRLIEKFSLEEVKKALVVAERDI